MSIFILEILFASYFVSINLIYAFFIFIGSFLTYKRWQQVEEEDISFLLKSNTLPEILFVLPMYNESKNVIPSLFNIINLSYRSKKIIIVNDGSTDDSLEILKKEIELVEIPKTYAEPLPSRPVRGVYQSKKYEEIIVIDKENGGKFDGVNAAINAVDTPFFVIVDADTMLDNQGFEKLVRPILTTPETIAVGASVRIMNGCEIDFNRISSASFPREYLPAMQSLEYLRSFLIRNGLDMFNLNYIVSGAFSIFPRDLIVQAGGFSRTVGEDVEIIVRLHRIMCELKLPYKVKYLYDPVAWTMAPTSLSILSKQRQRWHRGLLEAFWHHKRVFFRPGYGRFGFFGLPFLLIGEGLEPLMEVLAISFLIWAFWVGLLNISVFLTFIAITLGFTIVFNFSALCIEELTFRKYPTLRSLTVLLFCNFVENVGYRQMSLYWRLKGFYLFFKNLRATNEETKSLNERVAHCVANWKGAEIEDEPTVAVQEEQERSHP